MSQNSVLISGASGNLGKAVVNYFLQQDWQVNALVHHQKIKQEKNKNYSEFEVDLTDKFASKKCISKIIQNQKTINAAVLTAGGFKMGKLENTSVKDLEQQFRLNFFTAYNVVQPLVSHMKGRGQGKLFFIGSQPGMDTRKGKTTIAYSLSKSLLFQFANMINADMKSTGIQAHVIVPSTIDTPENRKGVPDADFSKWEKPKDIAKIIGKYATQPNPSTKTVIVVQNEL